MRGWRCCRSRLRPRRAAGRAAAKAVLAMGFLGGQEVIWLPHAAAHHPRGSTGGRNHALQSVLAGSGSRVDAREARHCLPSPRESRAWALLQIVGEGASDRGAAGRPSPGIAQEDSAAGSCPRDLCQLGEDLSGIEIRDSGLRLEGRDHAQGRVRRREHLVGDVAGRVHRRSYACSALCAEHADAERCRPSARGRAPTVDLTWDTTRPIHRPCCAGFCLAPTNWSRTCKIRASSDTLKLNSRRTGVKSGIRLGCAIRSSVQETPYGCSLHLSSDRSSDGRAATRKACAP